MSQELVYTSAPQGLKPGSRGFCTVAVPGPDATIALTSLRQAVTPERLQGRATASFTTVAWGVLPIGSLAGGVLGDALGLRPVLLASGVGMAAAPLWLLFSSVAHLRAIPQTSGPP